MTIVPLLFSDDMVGKRVRHRWSGNFGTIIRRFHKLADHAIVEWDNDGGRQGPYRLDVVDVIQEADDGGM